MTTTTNPSAVVRTRKVKMREPEASIRESYESEVPAEKRSDEHYAEWLQDEDNLVHIYHITQVPANLVLEGTDYSVVTRSEEKSIKEGTKRIAEEVYGSMAVAAFGRNTARNRAAAMQLMDDDDMPGFRD